MTRPKIPTYYGRLKVAPDAPPEVIRAAYRALVQKYHPDRHQGSIRHEIVLAALNKAQEVLLDPARRAAHDQWIRQEEVRLGWREPRGPAPGLAVRLGLIWSSVQEDGLPFGEAWRMHLSRPQRIGFALGGSVLLALAVAGAMGLLMLDADDGLYLIAPASVLSRNATAEGSAR